MIKEDFSYPKEEMDKLIVHGEGFDAAIWTDNYSPSVCYDFYTKPMKKFNDEEEERLDYKCSRIRIPEVDYATIVSAIIDVDYSIDEVQALMANYTNVISPVVEISDEKKQEYIERWTKFQELRAYAKKIATLLTQANEE